MWLTASAQTAVSVSDTSGWTAWMKPDGQLLTDPAGDQQTGQGADDFVGDTTYAGFFQKAGQVGGVDSLLMRARMNKYDAPNQWGNGGNWGVGIDVNGNGSVDLIMMMSESSGNANNRTRTITWGQPGTGANTSPSTTTWTFPTQTAISLTTTGNATYNVMQAYDGSAFSGTADSFVTFAVSFASLQAAVRTYTSFTTFTMGYATTLSFISFTSTQDNALNQDLFGTSGNTSSTSTWAQLGSITAPIDAYGRVPEPSTYAQIAGLLAAGGFVYWRRRRAATAKALPAGSSASEADPSLRA